MYVSKILHLKANNHDNNNNDDNENDNNNNNNKKAVMSQGNRAMPKLLSSPTTFTSSLSQASKAMLQSSKHIGAKQNLTQNGHSRSFKVTRFGVSGKAIRD